MEWEKMEILKNCEVFCEVFFLVLGTIKPYLCTDVREQKEFINKKQCNYEKQNILVEICLAGSRSVYYVPHTRMGIK